MILTIVEELTGTPINLVIPAPLLPPNSRATFEISSIDLVILLLYGTISFEKRSVNIFREQILLSQKYFLETNFILTMFPETGRSANALRYLLCIRLLLLLHKGHLELG
jgi:hypothetical protein